MSGYRERLIAYLTRLKDDSIEEIDDDDEDNEVREASYVLLPYSQSFDDESIGLYYECER